MFGDQVAPESVGGALMRLYELTVGLVMAHRASALINHAADEMIAECSKAKLAVRIVEQILIALRQSETWA